MPTKPLNKKTITPGGMDYKYVIVPYHRGRTHPHKSKWTISINEEVSCFENTIANGWMSSCMTMGWGIKVDNGNGLAQVGINTFSECLKIAKFIAGAREWHGYPGDHIRMVRDIPANSILFCWHGAGYISKSQMSKLSRNITCGL